MKTAAIAAWLLLLVAPRAGFCSVEVNAPPKKSSENIRVTTSVDGRPRKGVKVEIYRYRKAIDASPSFTLVTGEDGTVAPPALSPGKYWIVASAELNLKADLDLRVFSRSKGKTSSFSMELVPSQFPTFEQRLAAAEGLPLKQQVQEFRGIVRDRSGATVPGVSIEIMRKGTQGKERVARLSSDKDGRFSTDLPDGKYIAFFSFSGFQAQFVPFEVSKMQGRGDLQIRLEIGLVTE